MKIKYQSARPLCTHWFETLSIHHHKTVSNSDPIWVADKTMSEHVKISKHKPHIISFKNVFTTTIEPSSIQTKGCLNHIHHDLHSRFMHTTNISGRLFHTHDLLQQLIIRPELWLQTIENHKELWLQTMVINYGFP